MLQQILGWAIKMLSNLVQTILIGKKCTIGKDSALQLPLIIFSICLERKATGVSHRQTEEVDDCHVRLRPLESLSYAPMTSEWRHVRTRWRCMCRFICVTSWSPAWTGFLTNGYGVRTGRGLPVQTGCWCPLPEAPPLCLPGSLQAPYSRRTELRLCNSVMLINTYYENQTYKNLSHCSSHSF